jgi:hypothetical protein
MACFRIGDEAGNRAVQPLTRIQPGDIIKRIHIYEIGRTNHAEYGLSRKLWHLLVESSRSSPGGIRTTKGSLKEPNQPKIQESDSTSILPNA